MLWLEVIVVLGAIFFGARLGSIGIGYAGGVGVLVLTLGMGLKLGAMPIDVILIIMSVIAAIGAMQVAGGLDYMVSIAEKILRKNPKQITFLAPVVTYIMTFFAGTGHTAFCNLAGYCRSGERARHSPLSSFKHRGCCISNCNHRFSYFSSRCFCEWCIGETRHWVLGAFSGLYPFFVSGMYVCSRCGELLGKRS